MQDLLSPEQVNAWWPTKLRRGAKSAWNMLHVPDLLQAIRKHPPLLKAHVTKTAQREPTVQTLQAFTKCADAVYLVIEPASSISKMH